MGTVNAGPDIAMVGPKTFPPVMGGIETHVYEISRRLVRKGFRVKVIVPRLGGRPRAEEVEGVRVVRVPALDNRFALKLSAMPSILGELKTCPNALVHAHDAPSGFVAASFTNTERFVYTKHGMGFHESEWSTPFRQGIRIMQRTALAKARHVFCTDFKTAEFTRVVRGQVEILQNGVDPEMFRASMYPRPSEYKDAFIVLFVGRMIGAKGISVLLEAIGLIPSAARKKMLFTFVGDGPMLSSVKLASKNMPEILALGAVDHSVIAPYFAHANAYVLPSLSEGLPFSLLEAMAAGLPCVASRVGGIETEIPRDRLILVPAGSATELSEAIIKLFEDRALANTLGGKGREYVMAECSWGTVVDRIAEVYAGLLGV